MNYDFLKIASVYTKKGYKIFPLNTDKTPACKGGYKAATSDYTSFLKLCPQNYKDLKIGLPMLDNSLIGIDFDTYKMSDIKDADGTTQRTHNKALYSNLEGDKQVIQETRSGGWHLICKHPNLTIKNCENAKIGPFDPSCIDIRTTGYLVVHDATLIERLSEVKNIPTVIYDDLLKIHNNRHKEGIIQQQKGVLGEWLFMNNWATGAVSTAGWYGMICPWKENHSSDNPCSTEFQIKGDSAIFKCFHASCSKKTIKDFLEYFGSVGAPVNVNYDNKIYTASQLKEAIIPAATTRPEKTEWLLTNLIPKRHLTLLAGDSGIGKTTVAINIIAAASKGLNGPNNEPIPLTKTLIITNEDDGPSVIVPRLIAAGADMTKVDIIDDTDKFDISEPEQFDTFYSELRNKNLSYDLILIDAFSIIGSQTANSHNADQMRKVITKYRNLTKNLNIALIGIMHIRKLQTHAGHVPLKDYLAGSKTYTNMARSVLMCVQHVREPEVCTFGQVKGNLNKIEGTISYNIETLTIKIKDQSEADSYIETSKVKFHQWDESSTLEQIYDQLVKPPTKKEMRNTVMGHYIREQLKQAKDGILYQDQVADLLYEKFGKGKAAFKQRMWSDSDFYLDQVGATYVKGRKNTHAHYKLIPDNEWLKDELEDCSYVTEDYS